MAALATVENRDGREAIFADDHRLVAGAPLKLDAAIGVNLSSPRAGARQLGGSLAVVPVGEGRVLVRQRIEAAPRLPVRSPRARGWWCSSMPPGPELARGRRRGRRRPRLPLSFPGRPGRGPHLQSPGDRPPRRLRPRRQGAGDALHPEGRSPQREPGRRGAGPRRLPLPGPAGAPPAARGALHRRAHARGPRPGRNQGPDGEDRRPRPRRGAPRWRPSAGARRRPRLGRRRAADRRADLAIRGH